jgi:hypothetical protein
MPFLAGGGGEMQEEEEGVVLLLGGEDAGGGGLEGVGAPLTSSLQTHSRCGSSCCRYSLFLFFLFFFSYALFLFPILEVYYALDKDHLNCFLATYSWIITFYLQMLVRKKQ